MNRGLNQLQTREIFHLEFLRWLGRKVKSEKYALKGGVNLRFFFNSPRYSEDMDLDVFGISVDGIKGIVMDIFKSKGFIENLQTFGVDKIIAPNIAKAKQTETTQRFKVHLITSAAEDLFTKVEFSRRAKDNQAEIEAVRDVVTRQYRVAPVLTPHYTAAFAASQKISALAFRSVPQARDVFDLYLLTSQISNSDIAAINDNKTLIKAKENLFNISFQYFKDTVIAYLDSDEQTVYDNKTVLDEIKLKAAGFIDELINTFNTK